MGQTDLTKFWDNKKIIEVFQYGCRKLWYANMVFVWIITTKNTFRQETVWQRGFKKPKRHWNTSIWPLKICLIIF